MDDVLMQMLMKVSEPLPGHMIFFKRSGSKSHNTDIETSDDDFFGVYAAPTADILSLNPPADTIVGHKPDYQIHEVHKFCKLLLKGNPDIIESLYTNKFCYQGPLWEDLIRAKDEFLSVVCVMQYIGYAQSQLKKLVNGVGLHTKGGSYNTKWAYHLIRLLNDASNIVNRIGPVVWKEGKEREELLAIRRGEYSKEVIEKMAVTKINSLLASQPWNLPKYGDTKFLNSWLLKMRSKVYPIET